MKKLVKWSIRLISVVVALTLLGVAYSYLTRPPACYPNQLTCIELAESGYDGMERRSHYVDLPDGTRLAVDVIRPTRADEPADEKLPVVLVQTPYLRAARLVHENRIAESRLFDLTRLQRAFLHVFAWLNDGELVMDATRMRPWLSDLVQSGYVAVAADVAGSGASFGITRSHIGDYVRDSRHLLDWIGAQDWSNGRVGVFGQSYPVLTAYAAIASGHPSIEAAFVAAAPWDLHSSAGYPRSLYARGFGDNYVALTSELDAIAAPVDGDHAETDLRAAQRARVGHTFSMMAEDLFLTSDKSTPSRRYGLTWADLSLESLAAEIAASDVAVYAVAGWLDFFGEDTMTLARMSAGPHRLVVRPWHHRALLDRKRDFDPTIEARLWFDRWLKDAAPIPASDPGEFYFMQGGAIAERDQGRWCELGTASRRALTLALTSDRRLTTTAGGDTTAMTVSADADATSGVNSRWNGVIGTGVYEDLAVLNPDALRFDSDPFPDGVQVAGNMILALNVNAPRPAALHAFVEYLDPEGHATYLGEALHRVGPESERIELHFTPTAFELAPDGRLRLTLLPGDKDNFAPASPDGPQDVGLTVGNRNVAALSLPTTVCQEVSLR